MAKRRILVFLCVVAIFGVRVRCADDLSDFSNNLATDIGPLLVLFGESMTKQYLSESTSFLDYFIFAMAPIGIITAIVSTIRVCGHPSLRAFIGRSQEGDGAVEAELCSSTSRDVCELFNKGGITRVLGKPDILELIYLPRDGKVDLFRNYLANLGYAEHPDNCWWEKEHGSTSRLFGRTKVPHSKDSKAAAAFAPNPNLSLNVGIVKKPDWAFYTIAVAGLVLQVGVLALAGTGVWILQWNSSATDSSASRDYAPAMFIVGTVLLCGGMWSCAALIGQTTHEVRFRRAGPLASAHQPRLLWLQPGPQVIGDQSFDPFVYFDSTSAKPLQVWTSSRKDLDEKFETYTFLATLAVLVGYIMQFIGLRGMRAWVSLAQLGATLVMSALRGCLRMQRLGRNDNMLLVMPDMVAGHELDWLSFKISEKGKAVKGEKRGKWARKGGGAGGEETTPLWSATGQSEDATQAGTPRSGPAGDLEPSGTLSSLKLPSGADSLIDGRHLLWIRKQLAHLTGNTALSHPSQHQNWKDARVKVRTKAVQLSQAVCQAADSLSKRRQLVNQDVTLRIRADASTGVRDASCSRQTVEISLLPPSSSKVNWRIDSAQIEAILGLWMWTLTSDERVVSEDDSHQRRSFAQDIQSMRIVAASFDKGSLDDDKQGEMELWLGTDAVALSQKWLTLTERSSRGIAALWQECNNLSLEPICDGSAQNRSHMRRLCGWHCIHDLISSNMNRQTNPSAKLQVQTVPAQGLLLDLCAQELFTSLMTSMLHLLAVDDTIVTENNSLARLENATLAIFEKAFIDHGIGSPSEALWCLVPAFGSRVPLPSSDDMLSLVLPAADAYRKASEWDRAQTLLRWACTQHGSRYTEDCANIILGDQDALVSALRATGELYRFSLSQAGDERRNFGIRGIEWMVKRYYNVGQANLEVNEILECYRGIAQKISLADQDLLRNPARAKTMADGLIQAIRDARRADTLYHLCHVKPGDFGSESLRPALPLAVRNDWSEVVGAILEMKADPNSQDEKHKTALSYCAESGHERYARLLLNSGAFVDAQDDQYQTPLLLASRAGHEKVVRILLETKQVNMEARAKDAWMPLSSAVEHGHEAVVRLLLEFGADTEYRDSKYQDYYNPLARAAKRGDEAMVRLLLKKGARMDVRDHWDSETPLWCALHAGHQAVVRLLIDNGANIEELDAAAGRTPLLCAADSGHATLVGFMLDNGADIESKGDTASHWTPLLSAIDKGHENVVKLLLERGANHESGHGAVLTPMSLGAAHGHGAIVELLLGDGADIESVDWRLQTPLAVAADRGRAGMVRLLIGRGARIEPRDRHDKTPLLLAAESGFEDVVQILLKEGAQGGAEDMNRRTALSHAAERGHERVIKLLLEHGADIDSMDLEGKTPLMRAVEQGEEAAIQLLLDKGADMEAKDGRDAAMVLAVKCGREAIVRLFLDKGADPNGKDFEDNTLLWLAAKSENQPVVELLLEWGANANCQNKSGWTPLMVAAERGHMGIIQTLLVKGADPTLRDSNFETALRWAINGGDEEVIKLLQSYT